MSVAVLTNTGICPGRRILVGDRGSSTVRLYAGPTCRRHVGLVEQQDRLLFGEPFGSAGQHVDSRWRAAAVSGVRPGDRVRRSAPPSLYCAKAQAPGSDGGGHGASAAARAGFTQPTQPQSPDQTVNRPNVVAR
jgi:hypothetical protein